MKKYLLFIPIIILTACDGNDTPSSITTEKDKFTAASANQQTPDAPTTKTPEPVTIAPNISTPPVAAVFTADPFKAFLEHKKN